MIKFSNASTVRPNFLGSEIGLIQKTYQIPTTMGVADTTDATQMIVKAGTIYPANDATAVGIVFEDINVTNGDVPGSIIVGGRILEDRLPVAPEAVAAKPALIANGIIFDNAVGMTR